MDAANLNHLWASLLIEELARCGVRHILIAPGSRSTPLAVAAARNDAVSTLVHYDERGAAFAALGCSKTGNTAAIICSSGTAVANCFPAVAEACLSATPLIVISADRPPELQHCGANQTMPQHGIFGAYTQWHETLPCPDTSVTAATVLTKVDALAAASGSLGSGGAVHLNCMYREPLAPTPKPWPRKYLENLAEWENADTPYTKRTLPFLPLSSSQVNTIIGKVHRAQQGLLLIGRLSDQKACAAVRKLAANIRWPVFADIGANCRHESCNTTNIYCYEMLLRSESFQRFLSPDVVLHIGDTFVSKGLQEYLASTRAHYIHLHARNDVRDPSHSVTEHYQVDIATACNQLCSQQSVPFPNSALLPKLQELTHTITDCINTSIKAETNLSEITVASIIKEVCTPENNLFIGNSMPVRDMDAITDCCRASCIGVNRGVSGIDGTIATAVGMAWASQLPTLAVIGDTAALHDLNTLALLQKSDTPVVLIVINNGGGGIFSFLPIADHKDLLDTYFTNTHSLRFDKAAALFGLPYYNATTAVELESHVKTAIKSKTSVVIEVLITHKHNLLAHQMLAERCIQETEAFFST